jgi:hypothetical protein
MTSPFFVIHLFYVVNCFPGSPNSSNSSLPKKNGIGACSALDEVRRVLRAAVVNHPVLLGKCRFACAAINSWYLTGTSLDAL